MSRTRESAASTQVRSETQGSMQSRPTVSECPSILAISSSEFAPPSAFASAPRGVPPTILPPPPPGFQASEVSIGINRPIGPPPGLQTSGFTLRQIASQHNTDSRERDPTVPLFRRDQLASLQSAFKGFRKKKEILTSLGMLLLACVVLLRKSDKELEFPLPEEYEDLLNLYGDNLSEFTDLWAVQRAGCMSIEKTNLADALEDIWAKVDRFTGSLFDTLDPPKACETRQRLEKIIKCISGLNA